MEEDIQNYLFASKFVLPLNTGPKIWKYFFEGGVTRGKQWRERTCVPPLQLRPCLNNTSLNELNELLIRDYVDPFEEVRMKMESVTEENCGIKVFKSGWCILGPTPIRPTAHPTY